MANNPICASKGHGELERDLRGKKSAATWEIALSDPRQGSSQRLFRAVPAPLRADPCQGCRPGEGGLEIAH